MAIFLKVRPTTLTKIQDSRCEPILHILLYTYAIVYHGNLFQDSPTTLIKIQDSRCGPILYILLYTMAVVCFFQYFFLVRCNFLQF